MNILIVDDHAVARKGVRQIIADAFPKATFGEASTGAKALSLLRQQSWSVVVLDVELSGRNGLDILKDIKSDFPKLPVLILSIYNEEQYAIRSIRCGAAGYITKDSTEEELAGAIKKVLADGKYISPKVAEILAADLAGNGRSPRHAELSDREYQVLRFIGQGKSIKEIARQISLSANTISTYRTRILDKLNLSTTQELIRYALQHSIVE